MSKEKDTRLTSTGSVLREFRKAKNLTQEEVAARLDVSDKYISNIECGFNHPSPLTLARLCLAMGVNPGELFNAIIQRDIDSENPNLLTEVMLAEIIRTGRFKNKDDFLKEIFGK